MPPLPRTIVVLLNWNNYPDTARCIESLARATYPDLHVVVVDNGSGDGSGARLRREFPGPRYVFNDRNLGFARGCNVGIRAALEDPACRYVVLLNNDSHVDPGFLEPAVRVAQTVPAAGAVGGKIVMAGNRIWYAGGHVDRLRGQGRVRGFGAVDAGQYDRTEEVGFVTCALALFPRPVLERVGLLPEEYFFGFEEYDYSVALRRAGLRLYYVPQFRVTHAGDGSHDNWGPKYVYNAYRNKLVFQQKYLPRPVFRIWRACYGAYVRWCGDRWRRRWAGAHAFVGKAVPPREGFDFALAMALRDHNRVPLDEDALTAFQVRWEARRAELAAAPAGRTGAA
jgi:GT2 family glycosyltransferase